MLFSLPNEYDKQIGYLIIGLTCGAHLALLALFFWVEGYFFQEKPLIFDLSHMGSRVSMLSMPRPQSTTGVKNPAKKQPVQKTPQRKKEPVKKAVPKKQVQKKPVVKKQPVKKVAPKKVPAKTIPIKKIPVTKTPPKKAETKKAGSAAPVTPVVPVPKEFNVADAAVSSDKVIREIYRHLTIPPGIEEVAAFTITFDIDDKGKVINLQPKGSEPLVMYTAFKDALLRCTMPIKNRKNIPLVIK